MLLFSIFWNINCVSSARWIHCIEDLVRLWARTIAAVPQTSPATHHHQVGNRRLGAAILIVVFIVICPVNCFRRLVKAFLV